MSEKWQWSAVIVPAAMLLIACLCVMLFADKKVYADENGPTDCRVVLALDRSVSIDTALDTMKTNVAGLLDRLTYSQVGKNIELAFWTFSHEPSGEYNKYATNGYARIGDPADEAMFTDELSRIDLDGLTNYEQALSYNNGVANTNSNIANIRSDADVMVIVTDGLPNFPGNEDPNDASNTPVTSETSARNAVLKLKEDSSKPDFAILGAAVGVSQRSLNYTINGDKNNGTNVGPLGFNDIENYLTLAIRNACDAITNTSYSLVPSVRVDGTTAVRSGSAVSMTYAVDVADNTTGNAVTSGWSVKQVVVKPGAGNENPILFGQTGSNCGSVSAPYCDTMSCPRIESAAFLGSNGDCTDAPSAPGGDSSCTINCQQYNMTGSSVPLMTRQETIPDGLELGTKVCYILTLTNPATGRAERYSPAACVTVGKSPSVQVWGGDVRVGRLFSDDTSGQINTEQSGVYTTNFTMPDNKRYGSWNEYGIFARSSIVGAASLAGLAGGYSAPSVSGDAACRDPGLRSLTFANTVTVPANECGHFGSMSGIPRTATALAAVELAAPGAALANISPLSVNLPVSGRYTVSGGTADITIGASTIEPGRQIILDARGRNVIIDGDIRYANDNNGDAYTDVKQIPQLVILARNITINRGVENVDAWLIANGNSVAGDGMVKTCDINSANPLPFSASTCDRLLKVNGPIMARYLQLWRTTGAEDTDVDCDRDDPSPDCSDAQRPAEIVNLPGASLLWAAKDPERPKAQTSYTYELPPYF